VSRDDFPAATRRDDDEWDEDTVNPDTIDQILNLSLGIAINRKTELV